MYEYAFIVIVWVMLVSTVWIGPLPGAQYTATKCVLVITLVAALIWNPSSPVVGLYAIWVALVILQGAIMQSPLKSEFYTDSIDNATERPRLTVVRWGTHDDPKYSIDVRPLLANINSKEVVSTQTFLNAIDGEKHLRFQYLQPTEVLTRSSSQPGADSADKTAKMVVAYIVKDGDSVENEFIRFLQNPTFMNLLNDSQFRVEFMPADSKQQSPHKTLNITDVVRQSLINNKFANINQNMTLSHFFDTIFPEERTRLYYQTNDQTTMVAASDPVYLYRPNETSPLGLLEKFTLQGEKMNESASTSSTIEDTNTYTGDANASQMSDNDLKETTPSSINATSQAFSMPVFDRDCTDACVSILTKISESGDNWDDIGQSIRRLEQSTDSCDKACYKYLLAYFRGQMNRLAVEIESIRKIPEDRLQSIAQKVPLLLLRDQLANPLETIRSQGTYQTLTLSQIYDKINDMITKTQDPQSLRKAMATELNAYLEKMVIYLNTNRTLAISACTNDCKWPCSDVRFGKGEMTIYNCRSCTETSDNKCRPGTDEYGAKWSLDTYFAPFNNDA